MSWKRSSFAKSADAGKDLVGSLDPREGLGIGVVGSEVETQGIFELACAAVRPTPEVALCEGGEPTLDLVDPGAIGRRVVDLEPGMAKQPITNQRSFMSAVVVQDDVDLELGRDLLLKPVQEALELGRAVAPVDFAEKMG